LLKQIFFRFGIGFYSLPLPDKEYNMKVSPELKGHLAIFLAMVLFGLISPIGKSVLVYIAPLSLNTLRLGGACTAFWLVSLFMKHESVSWHDLGMLFFAAVFGTMLNQGLFIIGLSKTSPIDSSIITSMAPVLTMCVAAIYLKEPITRKKLLGIFLGAVGAVILVFGSMQGVKGQSSMLGDLLCLCAQLSYAIYLTAFKKLITRYHPVTVCKWLFSYAFMCYFPLSYSDLASDHLLSLPATIWLRIACIALLCTVVTFVLMMKAQKILRPTVISTYNYILPVVGTSLSVAMGLASFTWIVLVAVCFIFTGVYLVTLSKAAR